jgi:hypothetical protein
MSKTPARHLRVGMAAVLAAWIVSFPAAAEIKLTELDGEWKGSGTDRDTPLESLQQTSCQSKNRADLRRMSSEIVCSGQAKLHKVIQLTVTVEGNQIVGDLVQTSTTAGGMATVRKGSVSGRRTGDAAVLQVRFPGLTPNATVNLILNNPSSYSIQAASLGAILMDVTFNRATKR